VQRTQKLAVETSNVENVLGDGKGAAKNTPSLSIFSVSSCGNWMATVETNWDTMNGICLKIWRFTSQVSAYVRPAEQKHVYELQFGYWKIYLPRPLQYDVFIYCLKQPSFFYCLKRQKRHF
jgi:hypothetical protein